MEKDFDCNADPATKKPKTDGFRNTSQRLRQGKEKHLGHRASLDWRQDHARICGRLEGDVEETVSIDELKNILMKSRTGEALFAAADAEAHEIHYDMQIFHMQIYSSGGKNIITLNPHRPKGNLLVSLSRGLRHAGQQRQGALANPMEFSPEEAILVNRAQQADAFMISVKIAWELKLAGEQEAWNFITESPMADMAHMFESFAKKDFRSLNNGEASRAAYDKFFEDSRTKMHDKQIIHQMLLDDRGYMKTPRQHRRADMDLFRKLGELPHGRNYLSAGNSRLPTDACYSTIEDRSNANFLWFIKFEHSFQQKEAEMIQESVKISGEVVDFVKWSLRASVERKP